MGLDFFTTMFIFLGIASAIIFIEGADKLYHSIKLGRKMRSLKRDKRGLIYIWVIVLLSIPFFAFLYYILIGPATAIINVAALTPNLPPQAVTTINLWLSIFAWFGMVFLIDMLIWAISNSQKRSAYQ